jgi:hypothetical protein
VRRGWRDALSGDYWRVFQGLVLDQKGIKETSGVVFFYPVLQLSCTTNKEMEGERRGIEDNTGMLELRD